MDDDSHWHSFNEDIQYWWNSKKNISRRMLHLSVSVRSTSKSDDEWIHTCKFDQPYTTRVFALIKCSITQASPSTRRADEKINTCLFSVSSLSPIRRSTPIFLPHIERSPNILFRYTSLLLALSPIRLPPDELSPERDRVIKSTRCRFSSSPSSSTSIDKKKDLI